MISIYLTLLFISPQDWLPPFAGLPVDYWVYPAWLIVLVIMGRLPLMLRFSWQDAFFALFVAWMTVSAVANYGRGIDGFQLYMYAKWFVLYKMVAASLPTVGALRRTGGLIVLAALVLMVESIQHYHDPNQVGWAGQSLGWISQSAMESGVTGRTRWVSIFDGPGVFCVIFTIALPFLLHSLDRSFSPFRRLTAAMLTGPLLLAIYYTGSRGGFLTTLAILALHFGVRTKISWTKLTAVAVLLLAIYMAAPAYMTQIRDNEHSAQNRVVVWMEGLWMVRYNPVLGVGRGNYAQATGTLMAHNSALELAAETGLIGVFLWTALLYLGFKQLRLFLDETEDGTDRSFALALGISLAGYIVSSMFVTLELETLYFLLGMTAAIGVLLKEPVRFTWRDASVVVSMIAGFLILLRGFTAVYD